MKLSKIMRTVCFLLLITILFTSSTQHAGRLGFLPISGKVNNNFKAPPPRPPALKRNNGMFMRNQCYQKQRKFLNNTKRTSEANKLELSSSKISRCSSAASILSASSSKLSKSSSFSSINELSVVQQNTQLQQWFDSIQSSKSQTDILRVIKTGIINNKYHLFCEFINSTNCYSSLLTTILCNSSQVFNDSRNLQIFRLIIQILFTDSIKVRKPLLTVQGYYLMMNFIGKYGIGGIDKSKNAITLLYGFIKSVMHMGVSNIQSIVACLESLWTHYDRNEYGTLYGNDVFIKQILSDFKKQLKTQQKISDNIGLITTITSILLDLFYKLFDYDYCTDVFQTIFFDNQFGIIPHAWIIDIMIEIYSTKSKIIEQLQSSEWEIVNYCEQRIKKTNFVFYRKDTITNLLKLFLNTKQSIRFGSMMTFLHSKDFYIELADGKLKQIDVKKIFTKIQIYRDSTKE